MNKIVREHFAVERLPEELRPYFDQARPVTVTVEQDTGPGLLTRMAERRLRSAEATGDEATARTRSIRELRALAQEDGPTFDDPVARIRALRDEWDD